MQKCIIEYQSISKLWYLLLAVGWKYFFDMIPRKFCVSKLYGEQLYGHQHCYHAKVGACAALITVYSNVMEVRNPANIPAHAPTLVVPQKARKERTYKRTATVPMKKTSVQG